MSAFVFVCLYCKIYCLVFKTLPHFRESGATGKNRTQTCHCYCQHTDFYQGLDSSSVTGGRPLVIQVFKSHCSATQNRTVSMITSVSTFLFKPFDRILTLKKDLSWLSSWGKGGGAAKRKNLPLPPPEKIFSTFEQWFPLVATIQDCYSGTWTWKVSLAV